jgi:AbrB family looped-hinge helix DNA binding protein
MTSIVTVSSKGQLVIPAEIRKTLHLIGGTKVSIDEVDGEIRIRPNPYDALLALRGCLKDVKEDVEALLMRERRKDRERDKAKSRETA